jgi:hypothetical protein
MAHEPYMCVVSRLNEAVQDENACVQVDTYPNHMVHSVHEYSLLERGDENPWMDDPSQPQPQHKHLRRISPGTRLAYAAEKWCQAG